MSREGNYHSSGSGTKAIVYVGGACDFNGQYGARAGIGNYWDHNDPRNVSEPLSGRQTNIRAELKAAERAIRDAKAYGYEEVIIRTDNKYVVKSQTEWKIFWEQNGWRDANGEPIVNRDDFESMDRAMEGIGVKWEYLPAHCGNPGSEAADQFARAGVARNN